MGMGKWEWQNKKKLLMLYLNISQNWAQKFDWETIHAPTSCILVYCHIVMSIYL